MMQLAPKTVNMIAKDIIGSNNKQYPMCTLHRNTNGTKPYMYVNLMQIQKDTYCLEDFDIAN